MGSCQAKQRTRLRDPFFLSATAMHKRIAVCVINSASWPVKPLITYCVLVEPAR